MNENKIMHSPQMPGMRMPQFEGPNGGKPFGPNNPPRGRGRPPGSPNKMGFDLMTLVMQAAENVGFVEKDAKGEWAATSKGGVLKYLEWAAVHKAERFLALMARVAPKHVFADVTHRNAPMSSDEIAAELRERGLPVELLDSLLKAPDELDWDEDPDPYHLMKDVTPEKVNGAPIDTANGGTSDAA